MSKTWSLRRCGRQLQLAKLALNYFHQRFKYRVEIEILFCRMTFRALAHADRSITSVK